MFKWIYEIYFNIKKCPVITCYVSKNFPLHHFLIKNNSSRIFLRLFLKLQGYKYIFLQGLKLKWFIFARTKIIFNPFIYNNHMFRLPGLKESVYSWYSQCWKRNSVVFTLALSCVTLSLFCLNFLFSVLKSSCLGKQILKATCFLQSLQHEISKNYINISKFECNLLI